MKLALPGSLLAVSVLLAGGIAYELAAPLAAVKIDAPRAPVLKPAPQTGIVAPPSIDLFADIDARPLFNPARTPLPDSDAGSASGSPSDLTLIGVMIGGDKPIVLLKSKTTSVTTSATIGDIVNGWRIVQIAPTLVSLRGATGTLDIPLEALGSQAPSAALAPPPTTNNMSTSLDTTGKQPPAPPASAQTPPAQTSVAPAPLKPAPTTVAQAPPPVTVPTKPALPAYPGNGTIAPEALKGAPIDPKTGQPTL